MVASRRFPTGWEAREPSIGDGAGGARREQDVNLALQDGGAHGAFAWGVLDRMLEDGRVGIEGISATSAGAMNAVVLAHGYEKAGREGAREALADFWSRVAHAARAFPLAPPVLDRFVNCAPWKALFPAFDVFLRLFSPYQFNPVNFNRPTEILDRSNEISLQFLADPRNADDRIHHPIDR